jgi:hypothetical protein
LPTIAKLLQLCVSHFGAFIFSEFETNTNDGVSISGIRFPYLFTRFFPTEQFRGTPLFFLIGNQMFLTQTGTAKWSLLSEKKQCESAPRLSKLVNGQGWPSWHSRGGTGGYTLFSRSFGFLSDCRNNRIDALLLPMPSDPESVLVLVSDSVGDLL